MARTQINSTTPDADGTLLPAATAGDATNDHSITNTGRTIIIINNSGVSPRTVSLDIPRTVQGQAVASVTRVLAAGERWVFGSLNTTDFGQLLHLNVDHADLKIDVLEP